MIRDPESGHHLLFIEVPEPKSTKNRIHLDLRPRQGTLEQEVSRVVDLGARVVADRREGSEICVLRAAVGNAAG